MRSAFALQGCHLIAEIALLSSIAQMVEALVDISDVHTRPCIACWSLQCCRFGCGPSGDNLTFFPLRCIITMPMIMSVGFAWMLVVVALNVCVRACVRVWGMTVFLIELSSCLKTVRFSSTFFYGTFEWCLLSVSFPLLVRKHTDGQQNKLIFSPFFFL